MRSFAGRDILSLKEFERKEFFHVFRGCREDGADRAGTARTWICSRRRPW